MRRQTSPGRSRNVTDSFAPASPPADRVGADGREIKRGTIRHRYTVPSKGIQMLRLERELKPILDRWRVAMQQNPKAWK
jgi:hypothetical protein